MAKRKVGKPLRSSINLIGGLDDFTRGYLVAALWSSHDESDPDTGGEPIDANYTLEHCHPDLIKAAMDDCREFQRRCAPMLREAFVEQRKLRQLSCSLEEFAGHDFWLTRNGHGAGFWDGDWIDPVGDMLTSACKAFGEANLYIGDDGRVHIQ